MYNSSFTQQRYGIPNNSNNTNSNVDIELEDTKDIEGCSETEYRTTSQSQEVLLDESDRSMGDTSNKRSRCCNFLVLVLKPFHGFGIIFR